MQPDKLKHLTWGAGLAAMLGGVLFAADQFGNAAAMAVGSVALGIGVELYQKARNEGVASWSDAAYTAAPGLLLAVLIALTG